MIIPLIIGVMIAFSLYFGIPMVIRKFSEGNKKDRIKLGFLVLCFIGVILLLITVIPIGQRETELKYNDVTVMFDGKDTTMVINYNYDTDYNIRYMKLFYSAGQYPSVSYISNTYRKSYYNIYGQNIFLSDDSVRIKWTFSGNKGDTAMRKFGNVIHFSER